MATETPQIDRTKLPPAGTWTFDKFHTRLEFVARHMLSKVRGRFMEFDGTVTIAERPEDSHVEVEMQTASITTDTGMRDDHLRSDDFLEVDEYPTMTFRSKELRPTGEKHLPAGGRSDDQGHYARGHPRRRVQRLGPRPEPRPSSAGAPSRRRPRSTARTGT